MSFRDFTPRGRPQEMELEGASAGRTTPRKSPIRRGTSDGSNANTKNNNSHGRPMMLSSNDYQQYKSQYTRSKSDPAYQSNDHHQSSSYHRADNDNNNNNNNYGPRQSLMVQQREEEYALNAMQQREDDIRDINRKMHVVNEIYKDLGEVVEQQQDQIDLVEDQLGNSADATRKGLEKIEKANRSRWGKNVAAEVDQENSTGVGEGFDKKQQFIVFRCLSKGANELTKMISACTSGNASYVDGESWTKK